MCADCGDGAQPASNRPREGKIVRHSTAARATWRASDTLCPLAHNMNTNSRNPVPVTVRASSRKSLSLLQMLVVIGASGVAVSLAARFFL
jgi:hypothetical protein